MRSILSIEGMTCRHCEKHVTDALSSLAGVTRVSADHKKGRAEIDYTTDISDDLLRAAVDEAGYTLLDIQPARM